MNCLIEICAGSIQSAVNAEIGGADRIELCDNLWEGGTTPSFGAIEYACGQLDLQVFVLVRPRGGDFVYTDVEFQVMKQDVIHAKEVGASGVVIGILQPDGKVDVQRTNELVELAHPMPVTFHRAFDLTPDPYKALEDVIESGAKRILTSGQAMNVDSGINMINALLQAAGDRIIIMPGGGVSEQNIPTLYEAGCREFHFSAKTEMDGLARYGQKVPMNGSKDIPETQQLVSDPTMIQAIKRLLDERS